MVVEGNTFVNALRTSLRELSQEQTRAKVGRTREEIQQDQEDALEAHMQVVRSIAYRKRWAFYCELWGDS